MNTEQYTVTILTPCFCAGADQSKAEIRAPSIRGQLRWWFRALGGTWEQEKAIFGGVHSGEYKGQERQPLSKAMASALMVRIASVQRAKNWSPPKVSPNDPMSYIWHFASVSGERKGMRWTQQGNVPPETTFRLSFSMRRALADERLNPLLARSIEALLRFGGIGLRTTRGLGGLHAMEFPCAFSDYEAACERLLKPAGITFLWIDQSFADWNRVLAHAGELLKNVLRKHENAKRNPNSPLGSSSRPRQTSAVRFRVAKTTDNDWRLLLIEAPHDRVLESNSRRNLPMLVEHRQEILSY